MEGEMKLVRFYNKEINRTFFINPDKIVAIYELPIGLTVIDCGGKEPYFVTVPVEKVISQLVNSND